MREACSQGWRGVDYESDVIAVGKALHGDYRVCKTVHLPTPTS
jgi:hypothetical protein